MANTIVQLHSLPSLGALTLNIYPRAGGAIENGAGDALTESGTTPGLYTATVTEALIGIHAARVYSGSDLIGSYLIDLLDDTAAYDLADPAIAVGANSLAAAEIGAGIDVGDISLTVQPYSTTAPQRVIGTRITLFEDEVGFWVSMTAYNADRTALNLTGKQLQLIVEDNEATVLATLEEAADVLEKVSAAAGTWRFKVTAAMCPAIAENSDAHWWTLSDVTSGVSEVLAWGRLWVQRRAGH